jgi:acyl-CoA synthetase (AMP-forming)/AMP-acid ligase II
MKWGITELQAVSMTLLSFQVTTWETPIEDAINEHPAVAESAIVGFPHDIKGMHYMALLF